MKFKDTEQGDDAPHCGGALNHTPLRRLRKEEGHLRPLVLSTSSTRIWFYQSSDTTFTDLLPYTEAPPGAPREPRRPGAPAPQGPLCLGEGVRLARTHGAKHGLGARTQKRRQPRDRSLGRPRGMCALHMSGHVACRLDGYSFGHVTGRYNRCKSMDAKG